MILCQHFSNLSTIVKNILSICDKLKELYVVLLEPKRFLFCSGQANKKSVNFT